MEHYYNNIVNWFNFQDIYSEMVSNASDGDHFVELGVWRGGSSAFMGVEIYNSKKKIKFDAIDSYDSINNFADSANQQLVSSDELSKIYEEAKLNLKPLIDLGIINLIKGFTTDIVKNYEDESLDFCFIDASHDYESVKRDIIDWLPKIKNGGTLAGHDYDEYHAECHKAVNDVLGKENVVMIGTSFVYKKDN